MGREAPPMSEGVRTCSPAPSACKSFASCSSKTMPRSASSTGIEPRLRPRNRGAETKSPADPGHFDQCGGRDPRLQAPVHSVCARRAGSRFFWMRPPRPPRDAVLSRSRVRRPTASEKPSDRRRAASWRLDPDGVPSMRGAAVMVALPAPPVCSTVLHRPQKVSMVKCAPADWSSIIQAPRLDPKE